MQKVKKLPFLQILPIAFFMACFLIYPERYTDLVLEGASLWAICVLPATLPFLFLTSLLTHRKDFPKFAAKLSRPAGKLFRISGAGGLCAALSFLSGYPVGAKSVLDLNARGALQKEETFRVACLASTSGPMFLVGAVGAGMFENAAVGWLMYLAHISGILIVCFFLRFTAKKRPVSATVPPPPKQPDNVLLECVLSVLTVGGAIAVYYAFAGIVCDLIAQAGLNNEYAAALVTGLMEMTSGCALLAAHPSALSMALSCFLITFGGGCVLTQEMSFLSRAGVKKLPFIGIKLLQAVLAFFIMLLFIFLFGL